MNHLGFSIVIANYNSGKYLEDAILSVTKQHYPKVQALCKLGMIGYFGLMQTISC
mgnify:CR=1 FL=1